MTKANSFVVCVRRFLHSSDSLACNLWGNRIQPTDAYRRSYPASAFPLFLLVSTATAIFKYRLYDIDIIIRRTLSYFVLSGILVAIYFGVVVILQYLFNSLIGQPDSPFITVLSPLAIAGVFTPLRNMTQEWIDRRFYRSKYDAEKALYDFASTARDEVEMNVISARHLLVVAETLRPEDVKLLLKNPAERW